MAHLAAPFVVGDRGLQAARPDRSRGPFLRLGCSRGPFLRLGCSRVTLLQVPAPRRPYCGGVSRADLDKDPHAVATMFDGVARRYDLTNTVLTAGQDRRWRALARRALDLRPGEIVLDLAAGTAVSTVELARSGAWCVAADFSLGMLRAGAARPVPKVAADALALPFADAVFDAVTIAFGLRNVHDTDRALRRAGPRHQAGRAAGRVRVRPSDLGALPRGLLPGPGTGAARRRRPGVQQPGGLPLPRRVDPGLARRSPSWPPASPPRAGPGSAGANLAGGAVALHRARRP